tara:strand:- start:10597 stop:11790 length:1194 start_codon:yes stop_codon:yes gene_type:complete
MSENKTNNPLDGFKNLAGDIMPSEDLEIKDVAEVPTDDTDIMGADTGIKDLTGNNDLETTEVENMDDREEETKEESKEDLSVGNLEIAYKEEMGEEEPAEEPVAESDSEEVSQLGVLANYLKEEGVVDFDEEEFEDTEDGIKSLIENEIKKGINKYKEDLPSLAQEFIEYIDKGGDPQNFVKATSDVDFSRIENKMIEGKENLQKQLVAELMRREGFSQDEILSDIQDFVDGGLIEKRATRALSKLKAMQANQRKELLKSQEEASKAKEAEYNNFLTSLKDDIDSREEIAGFNVSKKVKKDFYDYITKPDRKTGKTRLVMDSEADQDSQLKMAWLYYNKFDFSKIEKKARTKATSSLKASLERASNISTKKLKSKSRTKATGNDIDFSLFENALKIK